MSPSYNCPPKCSRCHRLHHSTEPCKTEEPEDDSGLIISGYKQVIVVRKDLNMRKGKIAAQVAHASLGAILQQIEYKRCNGKGGVAFDRETCEWLSGPFTKVVLACDSDIELFELERKAKTEGLRTSLIRDAGKTEFHGVPTYTCLAIGPAKAEVIDEITGSLKLL